MAQSFVHAVVSLGIVAALYTSYRYATRPWYLNRTAGLAPLLNEESPLRIPGVYIVILLPYHSLELHIATLREAHVDITASIRRGAHLLDASPWYSAALDDDDALTVVRAQNDVAWVECNIAVPFPKVEPGLPLTEQPPGSLSFDASQKTPEKVVARNKPDLT